MLKEATAQWNATGHVPFREKDKLYKEYQETLDTLYERFNISRNRNRMADFTNSIQQMGDNAQDKLYRERDKLMRIYEAKKNEIQTIENNKGFFNLSSSRAEHLVQELDRKIKKLRDEMELVAQKIKLIDEKLQ